MNWLVLSHRAAAGTGGGSNTDSWLRAGDVAAACEIGRMGHGAPDFDLDYHALAGICLSV